MKALFITHAGREIGGGHLSRCCALSEGLAAFGCAARWILNDEARGMAEKLGLENVHYCGDPFRQLPDANSFPIVDVAFTVVDSYCTDDAFFSSLKLRKWGGLVAIDDFEQSVCDIYADILIHYAIGAEKNERRIPSKERMYLLGPRYALLRQAFGDLQPSTGDYLLFLPGAADVADAVQTLATWWRMDWMKLVAVCGPLVSEERVSTLRRAHAAKANVAILHAPEALPELMAGAGIVACSASVSMYEALALQKRTVIFTVAENQENICEELHKRKAAYNLGAWDAVQWGDFPKVFDFKPDMSILNGLVNSRGAWDCARTILDEAEWRVGRS